MRRGWWCECGRAGGISRAAVSAAGGRPAATTAKEEEFVDATALRRRGRTISAIARHLGRDRKTIRAYLDGGRRPGVRRRAVPDRVSRSRPRCGSGWRRIRTGGGPRLPDGVRKLGYPRS